MGGFGGFSFRCFTHRVDLDDLMADRVAGHVEPAAASIGVDPAFEEYSLGVVPKKEVIRKFSVCQRVFSQWAGDMRFAPTAEFQLITIAAEWAFDQQHPSYSIRP